MAQAKPDMSAGRPRLVTSADDAVAKTADETTEETVARRELETPAAAPAAPADEKAKPRRGGARKVLLMTVALAALGFGGWYGYDWWVDGRFLVETDDAYVGAEMATMAPKVSGYVASVAINQNQHVKAGDPLVTLDDGDYRLALDAANARIETQKATIARFDKQVTAADSQIAQAKAQVDSANADSVRAAADFERAQQLAKSTYGSKQTLDQATADKARTAASVEAAKAGVVAAEANRDVLSAQKAEAERTLAELQTARAQRQRDLDATVIRAPFDGVVGNKAVQAGDYVTPGKRLLAIVPLDKVYVDANFKETQLGQITPGSKVRLSVDAYPDHDVIGVVDSLAPASGAQFSLLPPENATGNFTKIVQRVPVRVHVDPADVAKGRLVPGLSVVAAVDVRTSPDKNSPDKNPSVAAERR